RYTLGKKNLVHFLRREPVPLLDPPDLVLRKLALAGHLLGKRVLGDAQRSRDFDPVVPTQHHDAPKLVGIHRITSLFCILSRYILAQSIHLCKCELYPLGSTLYLFFRDMVVYDDTRSMTLTKGVMVWGI